MFRYPVRFFSEAEDIYTKKVVLSVNAEAADVVSPDEGLETVDAIVVISITFFDEIEAKLSEKMDCPVISLEDVLCEV